MPEAWLTCEVRRTLYCPQAGAMTTALLTALLIVGFVWLSRGSGRRLGLIGAVGLLLAFTALPFVSVISARSQQNLAPTALALVSLYPALWLAPLLGLAAFVASARSGGKGQIGRASCRERV